MTSQEKRNDYWFQKLVPSNGKCETTEGEMLRAMNKIYYRYYNDGDYFYEGYGIETAGSAHEYLIEHSQLKEQLLPVFKEAKWKTGKKYEALLIKATDIILDEIDKLSGTFHPNEIDMLDFQQECQIDEGEDW